MLSAFLANVWGGFVPGSLGLSGHSFRRLARTHRPELAFNCAFLHSQSYLHWTLRPLFLYLVTVFSFRPAVFNMLWPPAAGPQEGGSEKGVARRQDSPRQGTRGLHLLYV